MRLAFSVNCPEKSNSVVHQNVDRFAADRRGWVYLLPDRNLDLERDLSRRVATSMDEAQGSVNCRQDVNRTTKSLNSTR